MRPFSIGRSSPTAPARGTSTVRWSRSQLKVEGSAFHTVMLCELPLPLPIGQTEPGKWQGDGAQD
jgi:hypothetical protein